MSMILPRYLIFVLTLCSLVALSGCGFQLYGKDFSIDNLSNLWLSAGTHTDQPLLVSMRSALADRGVKTAATRESAAYNLRLTGLSYNRKIAALTEAATAIEYRLTAVAHFQLIDLEGKLLQKKKLSSSRLYTRPATNPVANYQRETEIKVYLRQQLAEKALLQIEQGLKK